MNISVSHDLGAPEGVTPLGTPKQDEIIDHLGAENWDEVIDALAGRSLEQITFTLNGMFEGEDNGELAQMIFDEVPQG